MANTPFRRHKTWVHEGGISTSFIVHWPKGIRSKGALRHTPAHVIDIAPTLLELATGTPHGISTVPEAPRAPGLSLVPLFTKEGTVKHDTLWWWHEENRALRVGNWKIVSAGKDAPWELYDLKRDRSERRNLASQRPAHVKELSAKWSQLTEQITAIATRDLKNP
jgi:arylsulfatase